VWPAAYRWKKPSCTDDVIRVVMRKEPDDL
jgi:hypothetical protein